MNGSCIRVLSYIEDLCDVFHVKSIYHRQNWSQRKRSVFDHSSLKQSYNLLQVLYIIIDVQKDEYLTSFLIS